MRLSDDTKARVGALVVLSSLGVCAVGTYHMVRSILSCAVSAARGVVR